jgi:hypothetical protein
MNLQKEHRREIFEQQSHNKTLHLPRLFAAGEVFWRYASIQI